MASAHIIHRQWVCAAGLLAVLLGFNFPLSSVHAQASSPASSSPAWPPEPALVADINPGAGSSSPNEFVSIGSTLFFRADDDDTGQELWRLDPPYTQAVRITDIYAGEAGSWPEQLTIVGDTLFFSAEDGSSGRELWKLEPPYSQALRVADINPGSDPSNPHEFVGIGTLLFFAANDGASGNELWASQSPYTSAYRITDLFPGGAGSNPQYLVKYGWMLFFTANDSSSHEVWMMQPPYGAPSKVSDIFPTGDADPKELTFIDSTLFFSANDGTYGPELWMSEASYNPLTTKPVNNFDTRYYNTNPEDLYALGDTLFFTATIGFIGREVWKVTPPYDTTHMTRVRDVNPLPLAGSDPGQITSVGNTLLFTATDVQSGQELWVSQAPYDDDSTYMIDIWVGGSSAPLELTPAITGVFFSANDGEDGREVMWSGPPYQNAVLTGNAMSGSAGSDPTALIALGTNLFFQATNGNGAEVWTVGGKYGIPATGFQAGAVSAVGLQPEDKAYQSTDLTLSIEKLGIRIPIVGVQAGSTGWDLSWLGNKAGYLDGSAFPTWAGNSVITAHNYLQDGKPGPFNRLSELRWGDRFSIIAWGQEYVYEVREVRQVKASDTAIFKHEDLPWATLVTCLNYDEETGQYLDRQIVRAVQVEVK